MSKAHEKEVLTHHHPYMYQSLDDEQEREIGRWSRIAEWFATSALPILEILLTIMYSIPHLVRRIVTYKT